MAVLTALVLCALMSGFAKGQAIPPSQSQEKNPCAREVEGAGNAPPGRYTPTCTSNGWYHHQQFHGSTGYSWCVDPENNQELAGTRVGPGSGSNSNCPKCLIDKAAALPPPRVVGGFVPKCDSSGNFNYQQFHGSTGYSWCVFPDSGQEVPGTKVGPGSSANCPQCIQQLAAYLPGTKAPGAYVPQCDSQGNFKPEQSNPSTGYRWTVDPISGLEKPGSRVGPGQVAVPGEEKNPCEAEKTRLHSSAGGTPPGRFVPQCTSSGWYNHEQSHGSTGHTWCVDPESGTEISGTRVGPGATATCPKCLADKANALPPRRMVGGFVPKCDTQGHFQTKQSHPSTGYSWCVDRVTGAEVAGTKVGPGQQVAGRPCDQ